MIIFDDFGAKHKNFAGLSKIEETVKKRFNFRRYLSTPRAFECYYFNPNPCCYIN
jgi:hypothetical protein